MANNVDILDGAGSTKTVKTTDNAGVHTPHHNVDSCALPTGAATAAKQPAIGTAGTASSDVITVQGIASMTPFQVADNSGSLTVDAPVGTPVFVRLSDGSSAITTLPVSLASVPSHAVTNAGTFAVQESGGVLTAIQIMDDWDNAASDGASVSGDVAHDTADAGEPVKLGAKATTSLAGVTLVSDADRTNLYAGVDGVQITRPHCNLEDIVSGVAAVTDGSSTSVISAQGSGIKTYITSVIIANSSSSNVTVDLRDGTAGSVKATFPVPANGGVVHQFAVPMGFSANTAVAADPSASASTITTTLVGFKSKV